MAELTKRAAAVLGAGVHGSGDVVVTFKAEDGSAFQVPLHPGIVAGLAVALMGIGRRLATADATGLTGQPMTLTASVPAVGPQGQPVLDLVLEGGLHFPVTFPKSAIPILQNALAILQQTSTEQSQTKPTRN